MIAEIKFDLVPIIEESEAKELGVVYTKPSIGGLGTKDGDFRAVYSWDKVKGISAFEKKMVEGEQVGETIWVDEKDKPVDSYYLLDPLTDEQLALNPVVVKEQQLVDLLKFAPKCKFEYKIIQTVVDSESLQTLTAVLQKIETKIGQLTETLDESYTFNEKCDVHVGGGLITTYNEVELIEDACTDQLQDMLRNDWRIIACCVQKDQRRPDYILGRFNPG